MSKDAAARALEQIKEKSCASDLRARGVERVACYDAAFRGKDSRVSMTTLTMEACA